jgi:tripartite-type tricarboxylate transporter receptor subunit TctC
MPGTFKSNTTAAFLMLFATAIAASAKAADYPDHAIQLIVPYAPGGVTDQIARILSPGLENRLGQPVTVINGAGGSTGVGTETVARASPDGYTIELVSLPFVSNVTVSKNLPYSQSDFAPIGTVANCPNVLVVNSSLPANSLKEFIAYIKAHPGQIKYATFGIGSGAHLAALQFERLIGQKLQSVHYRGGGPASIGLMNGEVQFEFAGPPSVAGGISAGKLKPLAVASRTRLSIYPKVPTFVESGFNYTQGAWFGLVAPAHTPEPIIQKLAAATKYTMEDTDARWTIVDSGAEVFVTSPQEFAKFIADQTKYWGDMLQSLSTEKE